MNGLTKIVFLLVMLAMPIIAGKITNIVTGIIKSEDANVVVFSITDDDPIVIQKLEEYFKKRGISPSNPMLHCKFCSPELGVHKFKITNDNPQMIKEIEHIIRKYTYFQ